MDTFGNWSRANFLVPVGTENPLGTSGFDLYCQRNQWILPGVENIENFDPEEPT